MQPLTLSSEYAIRALTYLAQRQGDGYQLAREMAQRLGIPQPFLAKILGPLVGRGRGRGRGRGLLESQRGRGGGFQLARPPAKVTLYEIVELQETLGGPRRCFLGQAECTDQRACPMHDFWKAKSEEWESQLFGTTLEDMVRFCEERPNSRYPLPGS